MRRLHTSQEPGPKVTRVYRSQREFLLRVFSSALLPQAKHRAY